jgi:hydrogenase expression/formation protein HypC
MCLGIPMQLVSRDGLVGRASDGEQVHEIDLALVGEQPEGTWLLTFLGAAREVLDPDEAAKIAAALGGLRSLMEGGGLGDAFADLEERGPELPAHLQAARDAGRTFG